MPTDSNKVAGDSDLIELSDIRNLSAVNDDIEEVDGRFSPPQFVGASQGPFGGIHPDRLYDEVTEHPHQQILPRLQTFHQNLISTPLLSKTLVLPLQIHPRFLLMQQSLHARLDPWEL